MGTAAYRGMYMGVLSVELVQYAGAMSAIAALSNVRQSQLLLGGFYLIVTVCSCNGIPAGTAGCLALGKRGHTGGD